MKNEYILELLEDGKIEELKKLVQDEIYQKALTSTPGAKQRYAAMKRYFKYETSSIAPRMCKPCKIEFQGVEYYSFLDGYSIALTTENIGDIEEFNTSDGEYYKIAQMINFNNATTVEKINLNSVLAEAKSKGYKYKKSEIGNNGDFTTVWNYKDAYYKVGILEQAYSLINDGEEAEVYYINPKAPIYIKTSIGIAVVLPVNYMADKFANKIEIGRAHV